MLTIQKPQTLGTVLLEQGLLRPEQLNQALAEQRRTGQLLGKLNGRLSDADRKAVEGAFRLLQNQFLHGPISALTEETHETGSHTRYRRYEEDQFRQRQHPIATHSAPQLFGESPYPSNRALL